MGNQVQIRSVESEVTKPIAIGMQVTKSVTVKLSELESADLQVELYAGHLNAQQKFVAA